MSVCEWCKRVVSTSSMYFSAFTHSLICPDCVTSKEVE